MQEWEDGFFNSQDGDRKYSATDFTAFFADFYTNGIVADNTSYFQVTANESYELTVLKGKAYINGGFFKPKTDKTVIISESGTVYPRYDLVVIRWDKVLRKIYLDVVQGTEAETPVYPSLTRNETTFELGLAVVYVAANATAITQADITDLRFFDEYCGVVRGVFDTIDTTDLFAQYQAAWNEFVVQLGKSDNVTINTEDVQGRVLTNSIYVQQSFADLFKVI